MVATQTAKFLLFAQVGYSSSPYIYKCFINLAKFTAKTDHLSLATSVPLGLGLLRRWHYFPAFFQIAEDLRRPIHVLVGLVIIVQFRAIWRGTIKGPLAGLADFDVNPQRHPE